jgi:phosphinothricin acetyltransferase
MSALLRPATESDLSAINDIYNYYVHHSTCTYQEVSETMADRHKWFQQHGGRYPVIVAEFGGRVTGWGALSPFHPRSAFRMTVENSVYVHRDQHGQGVGSRLLEDLIARARALEYRAIVAAVDSGQLASIALHSKFQFVKVGHLPQVGLKFGRWLDMLYLELRLEAATQSLTAGLAKPTEEKRKGDRT